MRTAVVTISLLAMTMALAACGVRTGVVFEAKAGALTMAQVEQKARTVSLGSAAGVDKADAPSAREKVLVDLRTRGAKGQRAAVLLTKDFPQNTPSVPVWVGAASVDGVPSIIAIEAYPNKRGRLEWRRLWVFDEGSGAVRLAASYH